MNIRLALLATAALAAAAPAQQQEQPAPKSAPAAHSLPPGAYEPLAEGEGRAVAERLASELELNFVYSEQAKRYAAMLRANLATGRYDQGNRIDLSKRLTSDLQAVQKDGHLHVELREPEQAHGGGGGGGLPKGFPPLIQSAKEIAPGIAYIRFTAFMGEAEEVAAVRTFMADNKSAETLIFDLRNHHGGGLDEMDEIFPYLFAAKTPLVTLEMPRSTYDRHGTPFDESASTLEMVKDDRHVRATHYALPNDMASLRGAQVYLLVSNASASAAEHFALAFKSTGRATLIGEATAGANHFGGPAELNEHFAVWMPVGRTFDIKTGKDWEGSGIAPDIELDPKQALVVALEKAGLSHEEAVRLDATEVPAEPVHKDKLQAR